MSPPVVRAERIEFEAFAQVCDLHPELLDRFVALGLLEADTDDRGRRWLDRSQVAAVGRIRRLRSGLRLSYSAISVVAPLIEAPMKYGATTNFHSSLGACAATGVHAPDAITMSPAQT